MPRNTLCLHTIRHSNCWDNSPPPDLARQILRSKSDSSPNDLSAVFICIVTIHKHRQARFIGLQHVAKNCLNSQTRSYPLPLNGENFPCGSPDWDRCETSLHLWELTQNISKLWGRNFQERFDQPRHCNWHCRSDMTRDQLASDQSILLQKNQKAHGLYCQSALRIPYDAERKRLRVFKWQCKLFRVNRKSNSDLEPMSICKWSKECMSMTFYDYEYMKIIVIFPQQL